MAGDSAKKIKGRIRSIKSTGQITKAMGMVSASKLRRAQQRALLARPYCETLYHVIHRIVDTNAMADSPFIRQSIDKKVLYIVIGADRGLAGDYNSNILKFSLSKMQEKKASVFAVGKKIGNYYRKRGVTDNSFSSLDIASISLGDCFTVAKKICDQFLANRYDAVYLCYSKCISALSQVPVCKQLLPLSVEKNEGEGVCAKDTLYDPSGTQVLEVVVPEYLAGVLYGALCESCASEHAARRTAMDAATQNANEMITQLQLQVNRKRQAAVTQQIAEIISASQ